MPFPVCAVCTLSIHEASYILKTLCINTRFIHNGSVFSLIHEYSNLQRPDRHVSSPELFPTIIMILQRGRAPITNRSWFLTHLFSKEKQTLFLHIHQLSLRLLPLPTKDKITRKRALIITDLLPVSQLMLRGLMTTFFH